MTALTAITPKAIAKTQAIRRPVASALTIAASLCRHHP
jgi:hypothetical protein